jgi:hypothetical protein
VAGTATPSAVCPIPLSSIIRLPTWGVGNLRRSLGGEFHAITDSQDRRPRQRRVTGGVVRAVSRGRLARRASGGPRWVAAVGGAPSDAPVGRPRTPNVPARSRGVGGGVLRRSAGRRRLGRGARGAGPEVGEDLIDHRRLGDARNDPHRAVTVTSPQKTPTAKARGP